VTVLRALVALVVSVLVWPWLAWPAINLAFQLLTGSPLSWHWDFMNALFNWRMLVMQAGLFTTVLFVPWIVWCRHRRWSSALPYALGGLVLGYLGLAIQDIVHVAIFQPSHLLDMLELALTSPSSLQVYLWGSQLWHYQIGFAASSAATLALFWPLGVWGNPRFRAADANARDLPQPRTGSLPSNP